MLEVVQSLYDALNVPIQVNYGEIGGLGILTIILVSSLQVLLSGVFKTRDQRQLEDKKDESFVVEEVIEETSLEEPTTPKSEVGPSWSERLKQGLSRSRTEVWGKLGKIFSSSSLGQEQVDQLEEILYGADIGPATVTELIDAIKDEFSGKEVNSNAFKEFLTQFLKGKMGNVHNDVDSSMYQFDPSTHQGTKVIMIVGVNGAGKTTTIGKLATKLTAQGAKVVVGACDTFRAAAVDQLQVWCDRAGAEMIRAKEGANPSGVGYDAVEKARSMGAHYCLLDTAGRLHTAGNLMEELAKSKNVLKKLDNTAPHHVLLVIDAITGQNALRQAEEFHQTLNLTGLIFTKCDGSSRAGSAIPIVDKLKVPIFYIGVGESVEDLDVFQLDEYLDALLEF